MADGEETAPGDEPHAQAQSGEHDQAFFLALATKGKDAWNAWRCDLANKDVRVTFTGIDFSEAPRDDINFARFEFGDVADFSGCKWRGIEWEEIRGHKAFAPGRACFTGASFGYAADFTGAAFGNHASFTDVIFGTMAEFSGATFGNDALFIGATFGEVTNFTGAAFGRNACFIGATFGAGAFFEGAAFGEANFKYTHFEGRVVFGGMLQERWNRYLELHFDRMDEEGRAAVEKRRMESWTRERSGPDRFLSVSFANARFDGVADFLGRSFEEIADFTNAHFYYPPDFDAVPNASQIDLTGTYIGFVPPGNRHWTKDSRIPVELRPKVGDGMKG